MHRVVPELIIENFRAGRYSGEFRAVGMFMDLSGFSTMTDALMQHGQHGAEVLAGLMHSVFDPLVESIFEHGGKIVGFAGDGIMALYPVESDERSMSLRALSSANVIQQRLQKDPVRYTIYGTFPITAKVGLSLGSVSWRILRSGDGEQATYYFRGSAVDGSAEAEHHARAGTILLTAELGELLKNDIQTEPYDPFQRFLDFNTPEPEPAPTVFPPMDLDVARLFMPEDVIIHDIRGEFRQVVNLFMRFPDLPDEILQKSIDIVFDLRNKYGGLLTRIDFGDKGCNLLMLWGAPVAYENDISRALNFILDLQSLVDFPITAGVTYYIAHAGYLGSAMCEDYTCYGWGVNLASRFMMNATEGAVWVDERVARRIKNRFDTEYRGTQVFKGFATEQKVFSLIGRKPQELFHQGELVGREKELAQLVEYVEPLWQGRFAGLSVIWGDAGIGKSRLVYELKALHDNENRPILWALCHSDQILRHSFNPFRYWLLRYCGINSSMDDLSKRRAFDERLDALLQSTLDPDLCSELDRMRTVLGALLDLEWENSFYESLDAEARYNNTLAALIALIKAESLHQPMIFFIEDAQFLDEDSQAFLPRLKRSLSLGSMEYPVAILISSRHVGAAEILPDELVDHSIVLGPLSSEALATLAEIQLGGKPSPDLVNLLEIRSEGNPYFADQFLVYLQEERLIEMSDKGWRLIHRLQEASLPADIRALLIARLDQLTRNVREVIQTAAVLGREFEVHVLSEMLQKKDLLTEEIAEAEKAEIWTAISQIKYIFTHGLLRDAAYAMQMRTRRIELHTIALSALEKVYAHDIEHHYGELAYHAEHARLSDKALVYLLDAGQTSLDSYQNGQAADYFTRALGIVPQQDMERRFDIMLKRVEMYERMGKRDSQLNDLLALEQMADALSDQTRLAIALTLRARYHDTVAEYQDVIHYAQRAEQYVNDDTMPEFAIKLRLSYFPSLYKVGQREESSIQEKRALDIAVRSGRRLDEARVLTVAGLFALEKEQFTLGHEYLERALVIAREMKDRKLEAYALGNLALSMGAFKGNYALAIEYHEQAYAISREIGDRFHVCNSLINIGFDASMQGDLQKAVHYYEQAIFVAREIANTRVETYTLINLSALAGVQMIPSKAMEYARQAYNLSLKLREPSADGWVQFYLGRAYLLLGEYSNARDAFIKSVRIRDDLGQPFLSMEPLAGLVETALLMGDRDQASATLEKILGHLEKGGSLEGTDDPFRVYHICHQFLQEQKDPRARQLLLNANQLLEAQVSKFVDEETRKRFIEIYPWRRALYENGRSD